jgi:nucleoside 2-deoxyribosyltransferase
MKTFYLAHPFNQRKKIRDFELYLEANYNISLDNPFYDNTQRNDMQKLDAMGEGSKEQIEYFKTRDTTNLVEDDLRMIRKSDGLVAFLGEKRMIGTPMEIMYAARILRIPVYVITADYAYHPWIKKFATKIFCNAREFERWILSEFGERIT